VVIKPAKPLQLDPAVDEFGDSSLQIAENLGLIVTLTDATEL